jgi:Holliday junction resolvase RusA-like endonuclease
VSHPIPTEVETRVTLPFPPSVNRLYRAVGGRSILSETYRAWRAEAGTLLMAQRPKKMTGPVSVRIIDADDNTCVREITGRWVETGEPCTVILRAAA